jgi:hypothetical protein
MVKPYLYDNPVLNALDPTNAGHLCERDRGVSAHHERRRRDDRGRLPGHAGIRVGDCGGWGAGFCCDNRQRLDRPRHGRPGDRARGHSRSHAGLITPAAGGVQRDHGDLVERLLLRRAGSGDAALPGRLPLERGQMAKQWQQIVTMLAAAEVKRRIVACRETNERCTICSSTWPAGDRDRALPAQPARS